MSRTISLFSALAIVAIGPLALTPGTAGAVPVTGDLDGDLTGGVADCAPLDPSVHPGAADRPDLAFRDTNCDGLDGDLSDAIFVSAVNGSDAGTGTRLNPLRTVVAGVHAAASAGKDVYVAGGTYRGTVNMADGVGVYGGYELGFGNRSAAETTRIDGLSGPAVLAVGDTGVVLQQLDLHGTRDPSDGNSYGLRAIADGMVASQVVLENVHVTADAGGAPLHGVNGSTGAVGGGALGSAGGSGGCGAGVAGSLGDVVGGVGSTGMNGANGTFVAYGGSTWLRMQAMWGMSGGEGAGGRGGPGGTGQTHPFEGALCGGQGGTGGRGGTGGSGGSGGFGGAGSFGVYAYNSSIVAVGSSLKAGNGGDGGNGGIGGSGGAGLTGAAGLPGACASLFVSVCAGAGTAGQQGYHGGRGGNGGGGAGGPSAGVYQGGPDSGYTGLDTATMSGAAGFGGYPGGSYGGAHGANGVSVPVLRTSTAPTTSTYDFDDDGIDDPADSCPADAGDVNGCPTGPETSIESGPSDGGYLLSQAASLGLGSSMPGSTFTCSLDGGDADTCTSPHALTGLSATTHTFSAWATDAAGHADPTASSRTFTVPLNNTTLGHSAGWTRKTGTGYFRDSYSTSTRQGATLTRTVSDADRIALVATKAPGHGKVKMMLGRTLLREVNLNATSTRKNQVFEYDVPTTRSGTVKLVVSTSGKPVRIEGLGVVTQ